MSRLHRLWQTVIHSMTPSTEMRVFHRSDRAGNDYFETYDPVTGKSNSFSSEQEIRAWLDQSHH